MIEPNDQQVGWDDAPCREEIANVVQFVRDSLIVKGLEYAFVQDPVEPNVWSVGAVDKEGYLNTGLIGWTDGGVLYVCHDPVRENHDTAEGVPLAESKCYWIAPRAEIMVWHLEGRIREILSQGKEEES